YRARSDPSGAGFPSARLTFDRCHFGVHHVVGAGSYIDLHHQADARRLRTDRVNALLHHAHHIVPLTFDIREHRVRLVRQTALSHDTHRVRHCRADGIADTERCDREGTEHPYYNPACDRPTLAKADVDVL